MAIANGRKYYSTGFKTIIDHIDMKHGNNDISNLQLVSKGINLFRAYYKTRNSETEKRFKEYYNSLDEVDRVILELEIQADLKGEY